MPTIRSTGKKTSRHDMATEKTLGEVARFLGGRLTGDEGKVVRDVASIETAEDGELTFAATSKSVKLIKACRASAVILPESSEGSEGLEGKNLIFVENAHLAFAKAIELFRPETSATPCVDERASVSESATVGNDVSVGPFAVIEDGAKIGDGVVIGAGAFVGRATEIGEGTRIYPNVSILPGSLLGRNVIIHSGSVIGSDGFGYVPTPTGEGHYKIPQRGIVRIEDDAEIGAGVTIDRATLGETVIGRGAKIDNLVQIAHNVVIGEHSIIVSQAGISGSTTLGRRVIVGGQVGIVDHVTLGDGAMIGSQSGVSQNIPPGEVFSGSPAIPHRTWL
ncbi:MAG: UDP-3-O-(3-hydroxymyristoyl)glucosamine N-acyltransferase, partial [Thermodesulfobacteriota bacterium]